MIPSVQQIWARSARAYVWATSGFDGYREAVEPYTLEYAQRETGVPAAAIREEAHAYEKADRPSISWAHGFNEPHNDADNELALI